jgi:dienelactone hydrolase
VLAVVLASGLAVGPADAEGIRHEPLAIPATFPGLFGAGSVTLEAMVLRPADDAPHPLALINHGTPRDAHDRVKTSPGQMWPQAMEFARRGWTAVILVRRGYGQSGGLPSDDYGSCDRPDYITAGQNSAADLAAAIAFLARQPYVDSSRIISVGVSAGAFATVALASNPPLGLKAGISFAAGRGSQSPDRVCNEDKLIDAFRYFGQRSRIPMLWVYAENDHFFGPQVAKRAVEAFTGSGGQVTFVAAPAFGQDGHHLFSAAGIPLWTPIVDRFLAAQGLVLRERPIDVPVAEVPPPLGLAGGGIEEFKKYLAAGPNKAFANAGSHYGWVSGRRSEDAARADALANCARSATGCAVVNVNDAPVR